MENKYIYTLYPTGKYLPSAKYTHKQCGEYLNDNFLAIRQISNSFESKKELVHKFGFRRGQGTPEVGDVVVMDYGTQAGHIAIINKKELNRKAYRLTDCNLVKAGVVNNDFWVFEGDHIWAKIYGFARLKLNAKTQAAQPIKAIPTWAEEAVKKAKIKGVILNWDDPLEVVGTETLEWVFEKLGLLDATKHEGKVNKARLAVVLDKLKLLE